GRLDDGAQVTVTDLGHRRVGDLVDGVPGSLGRRTVGGTDVDRAVVLDGDVGTGVFLDRVDHLALGADDLTDLLGRHLDREDARGVRAHLGRTLDGFLHDVEDRQAGAASLL